jgi:Na+/glutamate symporter
MAVTRQLRHHYHQRRIAITNVVIAVVSCVIAVAVGVIVVDSCFDSGMQLPRSLSRSLAGITLQNS